MMTGEVVSRIIERGFILLRLTDDDWGEVVSLIMERGFMLFWLPDDN